MANARTVWMWMLLLLLPAGPAFAQTTASIFGTVRDATGAVVQGAAVTAETEATGLSRTSPTDATGNYRFLALPVGTYRIRVQAPGFAVARTNAVELALNQQARVDVVLQVEGLEENVTVQADVPIVNTTDSALGEIVGVKAIESLPLSGRNFLQLATLQPGVTPATVEYQPSVGSKLLDQLASNTSQVNGMRIQSNNYLLDGGDNNEPFYGFVAATPNPDAIQEFKIITNSYGAEFGRGGGGVVNVITRSGTNALHGALFGFLRDDAMDARPYFSHQKAPLEQKQFGGSLGGKVIANKLFFFGNYEGLRNREGLTVNTTVPSALERTGDFSASNANPASCATAGAVCDPNTGAPFPNNRIPADRIHPVSRNLLSLYPDATDGNRQFVSSTSAPKNGDQFILKLDHNAGPKDQLMYTYTFNDLSLVDPNPQTSFGRIGIPGFETQDEARFQRFIATHNHTFGSTVVNTLRATYNRAVIDTGRLLNRRSRFDYGFTYASRKLDDLPLVRVVGLSTFGVSNAVDFLRTNQTFQLTNDLSLTRGKHTLKFGGDFRRLLMDNDLLAFEPGGFQFTPFFTGNAFADFLLGKPQSFIHLSGDNARSWSATQLFGYAQDDYRVSDRLTLNLGLRYELFGPFTEKNDRMFIVKPGQVSTLRPDLPAGMLVPGDPGVPRATIDTDYNNFAPRLGFAWDVTGRDTTSLRGAYGIFYDNVIGFIPWQLVVYPGLNGTIFTFSPDFTDPYRGNNPFSGTGDVPITLPLGQINSLNPEFRTPYVHQWNLTLQHAVTKDMILQGAYVGTKGTGLVGSRELNRAEFVPGNTTASNVQARRPLEDYGPIRTPSTDFGSLYHSMQLSAKQRAAHGISFLAAYTLSKVTDQVSLLHSGFRVRGQTVSPQNEADLDAENGPAAFDVRHRFVLSFLWDVPAPGGSGWTDALLGNWSVNGIFAAQSGTPFSVVDSTNPSLDGSSVLVARPNVIPDCDVNAGGPNRTLQFFNTTCFTPVPRGTGEYGNAGRNTVTGPGLVNFDLGIVKNVPLGDFKRLQFRAEIFNVFNRANFSLPENDIRSPLFGRILNTLPGSERRVQLGLKFYF